MKKSKISKKIGVFLLATTMALGMLTGCGNKQNSENSQVYTQEEVSTTKALMIGDYTIYLDELIVYGIQDMYLQGGDSATYDVVADEYRKLAILTTLRENKIIYDVSQNNGVTLDDKDMQFVEQSINNFKDTIGQEILDKYGISDELIYRLFCEQACVTKFESEMRTDMAKTIQEDLTEAYANVDFYNIYYMTFPTVEIENGEPKMDASGNYVYVSDAEVKQIEDNAKKAVERLKNGEDYVAIAQDYGIEPYCSEINSYTGSYSEEMNKIIESLEDNEVSDPIESTLGYNVIYMIKTNDQNMKDSYIYSMTTDGLDEEFEKLRNMWLATIKIDAEGDKIGTVWDDFDLKGLLINMEKAGVIK